MTDSILMWLSQFNSTDLKECLKRDWKSILHTAHLLGLAHLTGKKKGEERNFIQRFC